MNTIIDRHGRNIDYIRISVTDRCNLRCRYCMPEDGVSLLSHENIMRYEEIERICRLGAELGIRKVKLTGGEPLVRRGITELVEKLTQLTGIDDVTMTSNGCMLEEQAKELKAAGLSSINVSLDTLDPKRFAEITGKHEFNRVIAGIESAVKAGLKVKLNCAVMETLLSSEVLRFAEYSIKTGIPVRFIEMMPIGQGKKYDALENEELKKMIKDRYPDLSPADDRKGNGPAAYYTYGEGKGVVGFISAVHQKFCNKCNRVRLTADGFLKLCLDSESGVDLRAVMRSGISDEDLKQVLIAQILEKPACHHFNETKQESGTQTKRNMNAIGG